MSRRHVVAFALCLVLAAGVVAAETIPNWPAPASWTPPNTSGGIGAVHAMGDVTNPLPFVGMSPCRIVDTRLAASTFGGPKLVAGAPRNFPLPTGPCTGISAGVRAYSLNITAVGALGSGFILIYPQGGAQPVVSTLNYNAGQTVANAAIVAAGTAGGITVVAGVSGTDLLIDINGYYAGAVNSGEQLAVSTIINGAAAIVGFNYSNSSGSHGVGGYAGGTGIVHGVQGEIGSGAAALSSGVHGIADGGAAARTFAVLGENFNTKTDAAGVMGKDNTGVSSPLQGWSSAGIRGEGTNGVVGMTSTPGMVGVIGESINTTGFSYGVMGGVHSTSNGAAGVAGFAYGSSGYTYGVKGINSSSADYTGGVLGSSGGASWNPYNSGPYGVRGISAAGTNPTGVGGEGISNGGMFLRVNASGTLLTRGYVGTVGGDGFYSNNNLTVTGIKSFVEPHPTEPGKVIKYVALEGPEAGTYFRGRGRFVNRVAVIDVPEDFRAVTDPEGLTVQITPIGRATAVGVVQIGLDQIEVESTRDVEFSYLVQGVRKAFKNFKPIQTENETFYFKPHSPDETIDMTLPAELRQRIIATGIYNADGTVNMNTAERLGWAQQWRDREETAKKAAEEAAAKQAAGGPGRQSDQQ